MGKETMYSRVFPPILKLHRKLVNSGCALSPPFVPTIPLSPSILVSLCSTSCSFMNAQWLKLTSLCQVLEKQRRTTWPCPHGAPRTVKMGEEKGCGCWVPSGCHKMEMGSAVGQVTGGDFWSRWDSGCALEAGLT